MKGLDQDLANTYISIGGVFGYIGRMDSSLHYYKKSYAIQKEADNKEALAQCLNNIGFTYQNMGQVDSALHYLHECLDLCKSLDLTIGITYSLSNIASLYQNKGELEKSLKYHQECLELRKEIEDQEGIAISLSNIGGVYETQGDLATAIKLYNEGLKIFEEIDDKDGIAGIYNQLGLVNAQQENDSLATTYFLKALEIHKESGAVQSVSNTLNNIGALHQKNGDYDQAIPYFEEMIQLAQEIGNNQLLSVGYNNLGTIYQARKDYPKAKEYFEKSLALESKSSNSAISTKMNYGYILHLMGDPINGSQEIETALGAAKERGSIALIETGSKFLWEVYKKMGRSDDALEMYEQYIESRDSILSKENQKATIQQEFRHQYEQQAAADSIQALALLRDQDAQLAKERAEKKEAEASSKRNEIIIYFGIAIMAVVLFFVYMVVKSLRLVREQKAVVEEQKQKVDEAYDQLEEKNTEILDSINYAKRIQSAILPPDKLVKEHLANSFVLYKPKDIVAGDFYWMESFTEVSDANGTTKNAVLFAAADCTGHGVPGAMVSVVCNNGLNRSVREYGLTEPGQILDKTREIVISEFEKSEEEVKDGMDVALVSLSPYKAGNELRNAKSPHSYILKYAGAHNPIWIIRPHSAKGGSDVEEIKAQFGDETSNKLKVEEGDGYTFIEVKAHKQPIGKYGDPTPFPTHTIELIEGDSFYIFSDGYADQFGGVKGKKFKAASFKKLLLSIQNETIEHQKDLIDEAFEKWKGNFEQLDDVCVIGVRI